MTSTHFLTVQVSPLRCCCQLHFPVPPPTHTHTHTQMLRGRTVFCLELLFVLTTTAMHIKRQPSTVGRQRQPVDSTSWWVRNDHASREAACDHNLVLCFRWYSVEEVASCVVCSVYCGYLFIYIYIYIQGVPGGIDKTSGECSLC